MASELAALVLRGALFAGLAILLLLTARRPLRRCLGAALAYQAWLLVPLVAVAALLPASPSPRLLRIQALDTAQALATQATPGVGSQQADVLLVAWACGALAMALRFVLGHHAFLRRAGRLTHPAKSISAPPAPARRRSACCARGSSFPLTSRSATRRPSRP